MRKLINTSFAYAIAAMVGGVFYREFTRFQGFEGRTALGLVHTHLFLLGMLFTLVVALLDGVLGLGEHRRFGLFCKLYNLGVIITAAMLLVRGVAQVSFPELSTGLSAAISGIAGIGHILTGVGVILFFTICRARCPAGRKAVSRS